MKLDVSIFVFYVYSNSDIFTGKVEKTQQWFKKSKSKCTEVTLIKYYCPKY